MAAKLNMVMQLKLGDEDTGQPGLWSPAWPIAVFLACFAVLTWPWVVGSVTIPWDAKAHFQPQIQFLAASIARGEWPWWNPYVFSGQPQIADPQSMIFSPPFLALALLDADPSLWAVDMTVLAMMAVGGIGILLWFRERGLHWGGGLVAALAFSFGAAMAWRMQHTGQVLSLAYAPWGLLALERTVARGSFGYGVGIGVIGAAILLGRDQVALLGLYLLAGRVLWLLAGRYAAGGGLWRPVAALAGGGVVAVALAAVPLLMTVLLAADSNRPAIDLEGAGRGSLHPAQLLTFVLPQLFGAAGDMADYWGPPSFAWNDTGLFTAQNVGQLYVGAIPVLLVLAAAFTGRLWDREIRFFTIATILMLLYGLGWYTPVFRIFYALLPGVSLYRRPADAVFLIGALSAILAGYGAHRLFTEPWVAPSRRALVALAAVLIAALVIAVGLGWRIDRVSRLPLPLLEGCVAFAAAGIVLVWARARVALAPRSAALGLAAVLTLDLAFNNGPSTSSALPTAYYDVLQPDTRSEIIRMLKQLTVTDATRRDRVELAGLGFHWPNAAMTHHLESTLGYNPVRLRLYSGATGAGDNIGMPQERKFTALMPSYRSVLADMLGLRFIATPVPIEQIDPKLAGGGLERVATTAGGFIYENESALPRVLFATEARAADFSRLVETGDWPTFDPRRTVLLERRARPSMADGGSGTARIVAYANTQVTVDVDSPDGGFLVLNDIWHPWWHAEIDGRPVRLLRANVLFRAVEVAPGRHRVRFVFRPMTAIGHALGRR
jgi:hypothetical protein